VLAALRGEAGVPSPGSPGSRWAGFGSRQAGCLLQCGEMVPSGPAFTVRRRL
jgi:hypothetical protein